MFPKDAARTLAAWLHKEPGVTWGQALKAAMKLGLFVAQQVGDDAHPMIASSIGQLSRDELAGQLEAAVQRDGQVGMKGEDHQSLVPVIMQVTALLKK